MSLFWSQYWNVLCLCLGPEPCHCPSPTTSLSCSQPLFIPVQVPVPCAFCVCPNLSHLILVLILVPFCPSIGVPVTLPVSYVPVLVLPHPCHLSQYSMFVSLCPDSMFPLCPCPTVPAQSLHAPVVVPVSWSWFFPHLGPSPLTSLLCLPGPVSQSLHVSSQA